MSGIVCFYVLLSGGENAVDPVNVTYAVIDQGKNNGSLLLLFTVNCYLLPCNPCVTF